jgi:hypothetical protein
MKLHKLLVPVDFSKCSRAAFNYSKLITKNFPPISICSTLWTKDTLKKLLKSMASQKMSSARS